MTATVTDASGRFVRGLRQEDFRVFEDGQEQPLTHFSAERVPVSLGIVLDTSGSMDGEKMDAAREALDPLPGRPARSGGRSLPVPLLEHAGAGRGLDDQPASGCSHSCGGSCPHGGTAMYDAIAEAIPLAQSGRNRKKALLIISDGNDTDSEATVAAVKQQIRESEVLVYAIGIDGRGTSSILGGGSVRRRRAVPVPVSRCRAASRRPAPRSPTMSRGGRAGDHVNVEALREITDDSGGRTEIVRSPRDLDPATAGIADELSQQYSLGYPTTGKNDGRWHSITVEVQRPGLRVRARRGFVARQVVLRVLRVLRGAQGAGSTRWFYGRGFEVRLSSHSAEPRTPASSAVRPVAAEPVEPVDTSTLSTRRTLTHP